MGRALDVHIPTMTLIKSTCRPLSAPHRQNQGLPKPKNRARHGLQTDAISAREMAKTGWPIRMPEIVQGMAFVDGTTRCHRTS